MRTMLIALACAVITPFLIVFLMIAGACLGAIAVPYTVIEGISNKAKARIAARSGGAQ